MTVPGLYDSYTQVQRRTEHMIDYSCLFCTGKVVAPSALLTKKHSQIWQARTAIRVLCRESRGKPTSASGAGPRHVWPRPPWAPCVVPMHCALFPLHGTFFWRSEVRLSVLVIDGKLMRGCCCQVLQRKRSLWHEVSADEATCAVLMIDLIRRKERQVLVVRLVRVVLLVLVVLVVLVVVVSK